MGFGSRAAECIWFGTLGIVTSGASSDGSPSYRRATATIEARVEDLLARMTLEEKLDQLHQCGTADLNPNNLASRADEFRPTYGSYILGGSPTVFETRNGLQRRAVEESRLGIPAVFAADVIHGWRTILPIPLAQACSWDPVLVEAGAALAAAEASAHGIDWTFAPMLDHCVDPRWGRIAETFGESPWASSVFGAASVRGYQGADPAAGDRVASCLKHYVGYGASEGGRDYSFTDISRQALWEWHLPAFEAGVRAGAASVMSAFNDLSGIPASANPYTSRTVLREQWGFDGVVVSDWNSVLQLVRQGFANDGADAAALALEAGVDLDMADGLYREHLVTHVSSGRVPIETIDQAVRRVLRLKFRLGLFERPYAERNHFTDTQPDTERGAVALALATRSIVLLRNDGTLPIDGDARIALIGPLATERAALLGSWAQYGRPDETPTIAEAIERIGRGRVVVTSVTQGCPIIGDGEGQDFSAAVAAAEAADVVVLCLGEHAWMSGENASRASLALAGDQCALAKAVLDTGRLVVLVVVSGRPLEIESIAPRCAAIVAAWQGGSKAAEALANILLGNANPSGRLAITWPRVTGQIPVHHGSRPRARGGDEGAYRDIEDSPLFSFGHGLSYTRFEHGPIRLSAPRTTLGGTIEARVRVTNAGARDGTETVLWMVQDPVARITRPAEVLRHFETAEISAGEAREFVFRIEPSVHLSYPDEEGRRLLDTGVVRLRVGRQVVAFEVVE
jgi:beta-glucosidase